MDRTEVLRNAAAAYRREAGAIGDERAKKAYLEEAARLEDDAKFRELCRPFAELLLIIACPFFALGLKPEGK